MKPPTMADGRPAAAYDSRAIPTYLDPRLVEAAAAERRATGRSPEAKPTATTPLDREIAEFARAMGLLRDMTEARRLFMQARERRIRRARGW